MQPKTITHAVVSSTDGIGTPFRLMRAKRRENGRPPSRAKACDIRDDAVMIPLAVNAMHTIGNICSCQHDLVHSSRIYL